MNTTTEIDYKTKSAAAWLLLGAYCKDVTLPHKGPQHLVNPEIAFKACTSALSSIKWTKIWSLVFALMASLSYLSPSFGWSFGFGIAAFMSFLGTGSQVLNWLDPVNSNGRRLGKNGTMKVAKFWRPVRKFLDKRGLIYELNRLLFPQNMKDSEVMSVIKDIEGWSNSRKEPFRCKVTQAFTELAIGIAKKAVKASKDGHVGKYEENNGYLHEVLNIHSAHFPGSVISVAKAYELAEYQLEQKELEDRNLISDRQRSLLTRAAA